MLVTSSPGRSCGPDRGLSSSFTAIQPCTRLLLPRMIPTPFSMNSSAMLRPLSFCRFHMSGGAIVNSMCSHGGVASSISFAASETITPDCCNSRYT